ncbi:NAD(P)/FAD-dependent oxidoreductase [Salibacterium lacus]|uniref:NAD(P)/FAD-dependent oxidoreductase n=1 Tax=Salibacterium lacus TaxID=1898109 RepID=A0ABW5SXX3_9BACI
MKIAIMGAGLSGLACASTLEKNGLTADIFEKRNHVGDRFINGEAFMSFLTKPVDDVVRYLSEEFHLYVKPVSAISRLSFYSERQSAVIEAHSGFITLRGRHRHALEQQLAEQVSSRVHYHSERTYEALQQDYTHVILATGDASYAANLRNFQEYLSVSLQGSILKGNFERDHVRIWLDNNIAPQGYAYLLPISSTEANLVMAYPDAAAGSKEQTEKQWQLLQDAAGQALQQSLHIEDQFQIKNYKIGMCHSPRIGNTFFAGNCFGSIMPFLGFGQFESILTGIYAAFDLCGYGRYEEFTKPLRKSFHDSMVLRQGMETLSNDGLDFIVKQLNSSIGKRLFTSNLNVIRAASMLLRPFTGGRIRR